MVVAAHVDDILAYAKGQTTIEKFAAELRRKFKLKDMGDAKYYMRCHITKDHKVHKKKLDQSLYMESMMENFGVKKASRLPGSSEVSTLSNADELQTPEETRDMLKFPYWEAVGALM